MTHATKELDLFEWCMLFIALLIIIVPRIVTWYRLEYGGYHMVIYVKDLQTGNTRTLENIMSEQGSGGVH
jgi:hypothetical protein